MRESLETGDFRLAGHVSYTADDIKGDLARRLDHYRNVSRTLEEKEATLKIKQKAVVAAHQQLKNMAAQKKALLAKLDGIEARLKMIEATRATNDFNFDDSALARAKRTVAELDKRLDEMARFAELEGRYIESGTTIIVEPGRDVIKEIDAEFGAPDSGLGPEDHGQEPLIGSEPAAGRPTSRGPAVARFTPAFDRPRPEVTGLGASAVTGAGCDPDPSIEIEPNRRLRPR